MLYLQIDNTSIQYRYVVVIFYQPRIISPLTAWLSILDNNFAIRDNKKCLCSDKKFTRAKKNYPSSARLARYIFHVCYHTRFVQKQAVCHNKILKQISSTKTSLISQSSSSKANIIPHYGSTKSSIIPHCSSTKASIIQHFVGTKANITPRYCSTKSSILLHDSSTKA